MCLGSYSTQKVPFKGKHLSHAQGEGEPRWSWQPACVEAQRAAAEKGWVRGPEVGRERNQPGFALISTTSWKWTGLLTSSAVCSTLSSNPSGSEESVLCPPLQQVCVTLWWCRQMSEACTGIRKYDKTSAKVQLHARLLVMGHACHELRNI